MIESYLAQTAPYQPREMQIVRDYLREGGSFLSVFMVLLFLALLIVFTHLLSKRVEKYDGTAKRNDPIKLFIDLLNGSGIKQEERKLLERISHDLQIEQPAAMLLSPVLFDQYTRDWQERKIKKKPSRKHAEEQMLAAARRRLFPQRA
jgi:hypothetical protein